MHLCFAPLFYLIKRAGKKIVQVPPVRLLWARASGISPAAAKTAAPPKLYPTKRGRSTLEEKVQIAGRPFKIKKQFLEDIEETRLARKIAALNKSLLIFHSAADKTVGIDNAAKIYAAAKHPKSFISLDRADHLLSDKQDAQYVSNILSAWAERYL